MPYETQDQRGIVAEAWDYLRRRFPQAELSLSEQGDLDLLATLREDTQVYYDAAELQVFSSDPPDDTRCLDERTKLLEFLNGRYAAAGLPLIGAQRLECYPLT